MVLLTIVRKLRQKEREIRILILGLDNAGKTTILKNLAGQDPRSVSPTLGFNIVTMKHDLGTDSFDINAVSGQDDLHSTNPQHEIPTPAEPPHHQQEQPVQAGSSDPKKKAHYDQQNIPLADISGPAPPPAEPPSDPSRPPTIALPKSYTLHLWDVGGQKTIRPYWRNYFTSTDALIYVIDSSDLPRLPATRDQLHELLQEERLQGASLLVFANKQDIRGSVGVDRVEKELKLAEMRTHSWRIVGCAAIEEGGGGVIREGLDWVVGEVAQKSYLFS